MMIIQIIVIIMIFLNLSSFIEHNKESLISGVLSGVLVGVFSWVIHLLKDTPPFIHVSKKICHYSGSDGYYRVKVKNSSLSNLKIISANFIISYKPNTKGQTSKNDIVLATKKEDPLLFGLFEKLIIKDLRTFDTFIIDAQKCIDGETIEKKTSSNIQDLFHRGELTIKDFFKEDKDTILSAVFYVQNYRTGIKRDFCQIYYEKDIVPGKFKSGRSLEIDIIPDNPNGSDV